MALTNERKLEITIETFEEKLRSINSWNQMKNLISNISPTMVKNFSENKIDDSGDQIDSAIEEMIIEKQDRYDLADEIANL